LDDPVSTIHFKDKPGLVVYVTCGDPDLKTTKDVVLAACDAGADLIELGVPFSDPVADGPVIQRASERALRNRVSMKDVFMTAKEISRQAPQTPLLIFSYLNPVLRVGLENFCAGAVDAGMSGALLVDLTLEEADRYRECMEKHGLAPIFLAAPTSTDDRLRKIARYSRSFIYAVSRTGVTGTHQQPSDARELTQRLRQFTQLPIAVGFGIATPEQFVAIGEFADAAVVGSAIVKIIEQSPGNEARLVGRLVSSFKKISAKANAGSSS
jgi:tryptophan synthase alpha chain